MRRITILAAFGDFFMNRREMLGIKRRAESLAAARRSSPLQVQPVEPVPSAA